MTADDLNAPLGRPITPKPRRWLTTAVPAAIAGVLALGVIVFMGWAVVFNDPFGGEPMTMVSIATGEAPGDAAAPANAKSPAGAERPFYRDGPQGDPSHDMTTAPAQTAPPGSKTVTIIDGSSGERRDVFVTPDGKAPTANKRLAEVTPQGAIPAVAPDGTRPVDAFAQPVKPLPGQPDAPRIALVMAGLGISATTTADAIARLPGAVTLAFAPYGADVEAQVNGARAAKHEVLLQVPMEPFDYPDNDPGPMTLLTSLDDRQNVERLHWLMSRFREYVGITNYMGARFTATDRALAPVLRETAKRGLLYVDDGSSARSVAGRIAGANDIPFAKADVILDEVPTASAVDEKLAQLEALARRRGSAVGLAHPLPASIERIATWSKAAAKRGLLLVPISVIADKTKTKLTAARP